MKGTEGNVIKGRSTRQLLLAGTLVLGLVVAACGDDDSSSAITAAPGATTTAVASSTSAAGGSTTTAGGTTTAEPAELSKKDVSIIGVPQAKETPLFVAIEKGYFDEEGLTVKYNPSSTGRDIVPAVIGGSADIGVPSISVPITAASQGAKLSILGTLGHATELGMVISPEAAAEVGITADGDAAEQLAKLNGSGLKIAVGAAGLGVHLQTKGVLEAEGVVDGTDVTLLPMDTPDAELAAFEQGNVDAFVWNPPQIFAPAEGVLVPFRNLSAYEGLDFIVMVATDDFAASHPDTADAFARGLVKGWQFTLDNPEEAQAILKASAYPNLDDAMVKRLLDSALANMPPTPALTEAGYNKGLALASLGQPAPFTVPYADLVDNTAMNEALAELAPDVPQGD